MEEAVAALQAGRAHGRDPRLTGRTSLAAPLPGLTLVFPAIQPGHSMRSSEAVAAMG